MTDLRDVLGPDLIAGIEHLVDQRIAAALAEHENGSELKWLAISEAAEYARERTHDRAKTEGRTAALDLRRPTAARAS